MVLYVTARSTSEINVGYGNLICICDTKKQNMESTNNHEIQLGSVWKK